jgi:hypothetical protein
MIGFPGMRAAATTDRLDNRRKERYAKPIRECRPLGPARAIGAGERPATTGGSLHNASICIKHKVNDSSTVRLGVHSS